MFSVITAFKQTLTLLLTFLNFANLHLLNAFRLFFNTFYSLRQILRSHGRRPSPRGELLVALLSGIHSEPLTQWCASHLSPQKVTRMHKSLDAACIKIDRLYRQHFHVAMEGKI